MTPIPPQVRAFPYQEEQFTTTAVLNGQAVSVELEHRRTPLRGPLTAGGEAVVCTVTAPISLSLTDAALILYHWNVSREELADDETVRALIAEAVVSWGCFQLSLLGLDLATEPPTGFDARYFAYCRQRAAAVLGATPQTPPEPAASQGVRRPTHDPVTGEVVWRWQHR